MSVDPDGTSTVGSNGRRVEAVLDGQLLVLGLLGERGERLERLGLRRGQLADRVRAGCRGGHRTG